MFSTAIKISSPKATNTAGGSTLDWMVFHRRSGTGNYRQRKAIYIGTVGFTIDGLIVDGATTQRINRAGRLNRMSDDLRAKRNGIQCRCRVRYATADLTDVYEDYVAERKTGGDAGRGIRAIAEDCDSMLGRMGLPHRTTCGRHMLGTAISTNGVCCGLRAVTAARSP